jgi:hypothetical protein
VEKLLLSGGGGVVVVLRAFVVPVGSDDPVALAVQTCKVRYDSWSETYRVDLHATGAAPRQTAVLLQGLLRTCFEERDAPIVARDELKGVTHYCLVVTADIIDPQSTAVPALVAWTSRDPAANAIAPTDPLYVNLRRIKRPLPGTQPASSKVSAELWFVTNPFVF